MELLRTLSDPAGFDWRTAPLSAWYWPVGAAGIYLLAVVAMLPSAVLASEKAREAARAEKEARAAAGGRTKASPESAAAAAEKSGAWSSIMCWHNLVLCIWSLVMMLGCAYEVWMRLGEAGTDDTGFLFCETPMTGTEQASRAGTPDGSEQFAGAAGGAATGPLYFWSYVYYLSKFYELADTILALAKGSPPRHLFLHVFHHALVLLMSWLWLEQRQSLQWIGLLFNTFVHVVMYYYFSRVALGQRVWWKNWITTLQIVQFVTSLVAFAIFAFAAAGADILPLLPDVAAKGWRAIAAAVGLSSPGSGWRHACAGWSALQFNLFFNVTLLFGFVNVLGKNTSADAKKKSKSTKTA
ncbi:hypothetical protein FNF27_03623 [Cafeteria roenbergensis]|uniref:Elongation of fatty acids protein n=1 Tax=Cafeteria roenbergensis TaxID=33653 RepID=A0A5A8EC93_CAFRO|nr:hypothetical protein FNF27_03623 [Cafeteria roenbergensis]